MANGEGIRLRAAGVAEFYRSQIARFPTIERIFSSAGWNLAFRLFHMAVRFYVGMRVAQYLGPGGLGVFVSAWAVFALLSPLTLGIDPILSADLVRHPKRQRRILGTLMLYKSLAGTIALCVIAVVFLREVWRGEPLTASSFHVVTAILGIQFVTQILDTQSVWLAAKLENKYVAWGNSAGMVISAIGQLYLVAIHAPLVWFAVATIVELIVARLLITLWFRRQGPRVRTWRPQWGGLWRTLKTAWPMILSALVVTIYMKVDVLMLRGMAGDHETGIYAAAVRISELFYFIPPIICSALMPALINARGTDMDLYNRRLRGMFSLMALVGYGSIALMYLVGGPLISVFYGAEFDGSHRILLLHLWAIVPVSLGVARSNYLVAEGRHRFALVANIVGAVINILLNVLLIPSYGAWGAAIATLISCLVAAVGTSFLHRPLFSVGWMQFLAMIFPNPMAAGPLYTPANKG